MKHLRQYIRQILLEDAAAFAEEAGMLQSSGDLDKRPTWDSNSNQISRASRRKLKDLFRKHADHQWLADNVTTIHWMGDHSGIEDLLGRGKDELSTAMSKTGVPVEWHQYGSLGLWIKGHISLAAKDMDDMVTGYGKDYKPPPSDHWSYKENPTEEEYEQQKKSSGINKQPKDIRDFTSDLGANGFPYILDADTWEDPQKWPNEALVDNWKAKGIILANPSHIEWLQDPSSPYYRDMSRIAEKFGVPIYDVNFKVLLNPGKNSVKHLSEFIGL